MPGIKPGDVVRLKSGGPPMTVGAPVTTTVYECHWFDGMELRTARFHQDSLEPATAERGRTG